MELRHLRTVAAVAHHRSFTRAAEELHLAQSAISQQIRRLETELGVEVFRRSSRSVEVTPEGRLLVEHAHRVLAEVDHMHSELEELTGLLTGRVAIGGMYPTGPYDIPEVLAAFRASYPGVAIHMIEDTADALLALLREDELDLIYTATDPDRLGDEFAATLLFQEEFVVAGAVGTPLLQRPHVTLDALTGEDLIAYRDNSALRRRLEGEGSSGGRWRRATRSCARRWAPSARWPPRASGSRCCRDPSPRRAARRSTFRPIGPEPLTWPVALVWRAARRQPPAAKAFLALALERAEGDGGAGARPAARRARCPRLGRADRASGQPVPHPGEGSASPGMVSSAARPGAPTLGPGPDRYRLRRCRDDPR